jgi:hypothetical protein
MGNGLNTKMNQIGDVQGVTGKVSIRGTYSEGKAWEHRIGVEIIQGK